MIAVSACLLGEKCRYDGSGRENADIAALCRGREYISFCPERLGGLAIPREPAEISGGDGADVLLGNARVLSRDGRDVTAQFIAGAHATLELLKSRGITEVYLKANSPSCGVGRIYDGSFSGRKVPGDGVTAALLKQNGITVTEA